MPQPRCCAGVDVGALEHREGLGLGLAARGHHGLGVAEAHVAELDRRGVGGGRGIRRPLDRAGEGFVVLRLGGQVEHLLDAP